MLRQQPDEVVFPVPLLVRAGLAVLDSGAGGGLLYAGGIFGCLASVAQESSALHAFPLRRSAKRARDHRLLLEDEPR